VHLDPVVKAGQPIQQHCTGAEIGRHFEAVNPEARKATRIRASISRAE
jgi:hypothetical protein